MRGSQCYMREKPILKERGDMRQEADNSEGEG